MKIIKQLFANCIKLGNVSLLISCFYTVNAQETSNKEPTDTTYQVKKEREGYWRVMADIGFSHWSSDRFRTSYLGTDLGFGLRINPGLKWLQLHTRYDYSFIRTLEGDTKFKDYDGKYISFSSIGLGLCQEFRHKNQALMVSASASVLSVNVQSRNPSIGYSSEWNVDYLIYLPKDNGIAVGITLHLLSRVYNITDEKPDSKEWYSSEKETLDRDLNYVMGVVVSYNLSHRKI